MTWLKKIKLIMFSKASRKVDATASENRSAGNSRINLKSPPDNSVISNQCRVLGGKQIDQPVHLAL